MGLVILGGTAPAACSELPGAFSHGVTTSYSDTLGGLLASHCEFTRHSDGVRVEKDVINWSGLASAVAICAGAWLTGAAIGGVVDWRKALAGVACCGLVVFAALAAFFA